MSATSTGSRKPRRQKPPPILVDRGPAFAIGLDKAGIRAIHLDTLMPTPSGESVPDLKWIEYVGKHHWIALCVNPFMYKTEHGARVFSLGSTQVAADLKHFIFGLNWSRIVRRAQRPDPCFWRLYIDAEPIKTIR